MKKRAISVLLIVAILFSFVSFQSIIADAATSLPNEIYLAQQGSSTCTLSSSAMMLRARMYLSNNSQWRSITEAGIRSTAWIEGTGLKWSWTYSLNGNKISVAHSSVSGISISSLKNILNQHKEGIVLYCGKKPHAVFLTDYEGDTFYCADPVASYAGVRRTLASSYLGAYYGSQANVLNNVTAYWYVSSYNITGTANDDLPPTITHWTSKDKMGGSTSQFVQGDMCYLCYKLCGKTSGTLFDKVGNYSYSVQETIYYPDGSVANTYKYNNDNNWIGVNCTVPGKYSYKIKLTGDYTGEYSGSFTVTANTPKIVADTSSVALNLSATYSKTVTLTTSGYLPETLSVGGNKDSSAFTATFDSFSGNTVKMTVKGVSIGSGTITVNLKNAATSEILASCKINVSVTGPSYTVSYDANGGSGAPSSQTKIYGQDLTLSETTPKGKSYTVTFNGNGGTPSKSSLQVLESFNSWNTARNGSGTMYTSGGMYSKNESATLYAQYYDAYINTSVTATRSGYYFIGWYDSNAVDEEGKPTGKHYISSRSTPITSNITLYAMWSTSSDLLFGDFNMDGVLDFRDMVGINNARLYETYYDDSVLFRCDLNANGILDEDDINLLNDYRLSNISYSDFPAVYLFNGISIISYPKKIYDYGEPFDSSDLALQVRYSNGTTHTLKSDIIVSGYSPTTIGQQEIKITYYQFTFYFTVTVNAPKFNLTFDPGDGDVLVSQKTVIYNSAIGTLPTPTRKGYTFLGWSFAPNSTSYISAKTVYSYMSNKTVYAQWKAGCESGSHNYSSTVIEPTCTQQGYSEYICLYCGDSYTANYTPALAHQYRYSVQIEPTETAVGQISGICLRCGKTTAISVPKLNSTNYSVKTIKSATCTETGVKQYTWNNTSYGTYSFEIETPIIAHKYNSKVIYPTCTEEGYTLYTCSACNDSYPDYFTEPLGHSYTYKVTTTPTTSATGVLTGTCSRCTSTTTVNLPKLNTTDYTYTVIKAATCTATGTGRYTWKTTTYGTFYFDVTIAKTAHSYKTTVTAPTCTAQGYTTHTCSGCGDSYKDTYTNALGHSYSYKVTTVPTTSAAGVLTGTCSRCTSTTTVTLPKLNTTDYTYAVTKAATCTATGTGRYTWKTMTYGTFYFDVTIAKTAHTYKDTVTAPTCTAQGYTTHTCSGCGDSYQDTYTAVLGHSYTYKVTTTPTTSATGKLTGTCSRCTSTTTVTLPKLNTTDYTYAVTKAATCTATGTGRYTWKTTTYGTFYFDVTIAKTAHTYKDTVTAPTCTAQGYTTHTCTGCGDSYKDTYTASLGHSYTYNVTTTPTTSATGKLTGTCSRCTSTTTVTLPKLNTTDYTYAVTKAATCTATGTGRYTWKTTTYGSFYFDVVLNALGHDYKPTVTAPTCTAQGYTTYQCSRCDANYVSDYTSPKGHTWDQGVVTTEPTENSDGVRTYTCTSCGATRTENIPHTPHTHSYSAAVTAPTCTQQGYTTYTCSCGSSYIDDYTAALGHAWDDGIITTQPTETSEGIKTFTCSRCGTTKTEPVPALSHTHSYSTVVTPPACTEKGYTTYTCACGDSYVTDYVGALGHNFVGGVCSRCGEDDPNYNPPTPKDPCEGYTDINRDSWYHSAADFVIERGLMGSTTTDALTFEPNTPCTRSMIVMILYNIAGTPDVSYVAKFPDVKDGQWYTKAVMWAYQNGIVSGYGNGKFGPNDKITREQMAVVLKGYADFKGIDTSKTADLSKFPDGNKATWSKSYISWAVAEGLISGKAQNGKTYLDPQGVATRAEVAALIRSFVLNILEAG